jgi:uncharacterized protein YggU (UPF0235/DUF167 family)
MIPWTTTADGLLLTVRLTPKGGRDAIDGVATLADGRAVLKARVRSVASEGAANTALVRLIAGALDVAPGRIDIASGAATRLKRLRIAGNSTDLAAALAKVSG